MTRSGAFTEHKRHDLSRTKNPKATTIPQVFALNERECHFRLIQ